MNPLKIIVSIAHYFTVSLLTSIGFVWPFYGLFQTRFFKSGAKIKKLYIQERKNESSISESDQEAGVLKNKRKQRASPLLPFLSFSGRVFPLIPHVWIVFLYVIVFVQGSTIRER